MRTALVLVFVGTVGCGDRSGVGEGMRCNSSPECAAGLLCDFGKTPHVCSKTSTRPRDMTPPNHDLGSMSDDMAMSGDMAMGGGDMEMADMGANIDQATQQDLVSSLPDLTTPDLTQLSD